MIASLVYISCESPDRFTDSYSWQDLHGNSIQHAVTREQHIPLENLIKRAKNHKSFSYSGRYDLLVGDEQTLPNAQFASTSIDRRGDVLRLGYLSGTGLFISKNGGRPVFVSGGYSSYFVKGIVSSWDDRTAYVLCGIHGGEKSPRDPAYPTFDTGIQSGGEYSLHTTYLLQVDLATGHSKRLARFYEEVDTNANYARRANMLHRRGSKVVVPFSDFYYVFEEKITRPRKSGG